MTFVQGAGGQTPSVAAKTLFKLVDFELAELAKTQGWEHIKRNNHCSRLVVCDEGHIDVPIYSIPDIEFIQLREAAAFAKSIQLSEASIEQEDDDWSLVRSDRVLMATRDGQWIMSDPRKVNRVGNRYHRIEG